MLDRSRVDHILRAAGAVTGRNKFVLIGSAAIAAWRTEIPEAMAISRDVDLFVYDAPDAEAIADQLDGALGQASPFDAAFGYYCDGVGPETAVLPEDWEGRAKLYVSAGANGVEALAPDPNDIGLSKAVAWRPKDIEWLRVALRHLIIDVGEMTARLEKMPPRAGDIAELSRRLSTLS